VATVFGEQTDHSPIRSLSRTVTVLFGSSEIVFATVKSRIFGLSEEAISFSASFTPEMPISILDCPEQTQTSPTITFFSATELGPVIVMV
jgi:hypothetical protein